MVPVAMRRWKPQMATLLFAGLVVVQLAFGPSMVYADLMAPWMLYSAIVYADPRNSKAFIVLAVAIGALASPVIIWSADAGPILNQGVSFDGLSPLETCSGTYIYGLSGDCATTMTTSSVAIFIFIAVYLFAAIIVAYWQRARRITVSMMHERNDALQAKRMRNAISRRSPNAPASRVTCMTWWRTRCRSSSSNPTGAGTRVPTIRRWPGRPWRRSVMNRSARCTT